MGKGGMAVDAGILIGRIPDETHVEDQGFDKVNALLASANAMTGFLRSLRSACHCLLLSVQFNLHRHGIEMVFRDLPGNEQLDGMPDYG